LANAWRTTINDKYRGRLINSERGLQAHFCAALQDEFGATEVGHLRLFIEPRFST